MRLELWTLEVAKELTWESNCLQAILMSINWGTSRAHTHTHHTCREGLLSAAHTTIKTIHHQNTEFPRQQGEELLYV